MTPSSKSCSIYRELADLHSRGFYPVDNRFVPMNAFLLTPPDPRSINKIQLDRLL